MPFFSSGPGLTVALAVSEPDLMLPIVCAGEGDLSEGLEVIKSTIIHFIIDEDERPSSVQLFLFMFINIIISNRQ